MTNIIKWRNTKEYTQWRLDTILRDGKCVICGNCHTNFHCNFKNSFRQKCTLKDWNNFLVLVKYIKAINNDE